MCLLRTLRSLPSFSSPLPLHSFPVCFLSTYYVPGTLLCCSEHDIPSSVFRAFALALSSASIISPQGLHLLLAFCGLLNCHSLERPFQTPTIRRVTLPQLLSALHPCSVAFIVLTTTQNHPVHFVAMDFFCDSSGDPVCACWLCRRPPPQAHGRGNFRHSPCPLDHLPISRSLI